MRVDENSFPVALALGEVVLNVRTASSFSQRLKGLLGTNSLQESEALHILCCNSVHTCFMRYSIDIVFFDRHLKVMKVVRHLRPWRMAICLRAASVLELGAGQAQQHGLHEGVEMAALLTRRCYSQSL